MVREPIVAGQFYPGDAISLKRKLDEIIIESPEKIDAIGVVSPHAGYAYSGEIAGRVFGGIKPKETYILFGPKHTPYGARFAVSIEPWITPLGEVGVDRDLAALIMDRTDLLEEDVQAHIGEHSLEVQIPFLQRVSPGASIIPIAAGPGALSELEEIARAVSSALKEEGRESVIVSSSDMTHFETRKSASEKDHMAIQRILDLDPEGLYRVVEELNISMCGYIPTVMMLMAAKDLGANNAELIQYADSGDVTGDTNDVVGYAGMVVYK